MKEEKISLNKNAVLFKSEFYQVRRMVISANGKVDKHYHSECTDIIIPLSGEASLLISNTKTSLVPDKTYTIESPEVHTLVNESTENDFVYLLIQVGKYDLISVP